jgi:tetratricopeptide (TPR) repeat protein
MNRRRVKWKAGGIAVLAGIFTLASLICGQKIAAQTNTQEGADDLKRAREYFQASKLDQAEKICNSLVDKDKGGPLADQAGKLLDQIRSRRKCEQDAEKALVLGTDCQQVNQFLGGIRQRCPDYPGLDTLQRTAGAQCVNRPGPPEPALNLDKGIKLFNKGDYRKALEFFEALQSSGQNPAELQNWIQKTNVELLVRDVDASLRRGDVGRAKEQLAKLVTLAPQDDRIPRLQAKLPSSSGTRQTGQQDNRTGTQDALLLNALREFYAGHLPRADQLLEQYVGQEGSHKALAYFYRGAILCTDDFLTGAKDQEKQRQAREFFSKARQADGRFSPSGDWVSPRIIAIYEKTATGS